MSINDFAEGGVLAARDGDESTLQDVYSSSFSIPKI